MADHIDKQIRDAVTTLLSGLATTGANVFKSRAYPLQDAELPALRIYVDRSDITAATLGGARRLLDRDIALTVEFCGKATASYDDDADAAKKEIEQAIAGDNSLGGIVKYVQLSGIEVERDAGGEQVVIMTRLTFNCAAITALNAPDVPL